MSYKCSEHRSYKGIKPPVESNCFKCWVLWVNKNKEKAVGHIFNKIDTTININGTNFSIEQDCVLKKMFCEAITKEMKENCNIAENIATILQEESHNLSWLF